MYHRVVELESRVKNGKKKVHQKKRVWNDFIGGSSKELDTDDPDSEEQVSKERKYPQPEAKQEVQDSKGPKSQKSGSKSDEQDPPFKRSKDSAWGHLLAMDNGEFEFVFGDFPSSKGQGTQKEKKASGKVSSLTKTASQRINFSIFGTLQSQNDFMREWLDYKSQFLFEIVAREAPSSPIFCATCQGEEGPFYRCKDCLMGTMLCRKCCVSDHARLPFHTIQKWNGDWFERTTLHDIGYILKIGHLGEGCPNFRKERLQEMEWDKGRKEGGEGSPNLNESSTAPVTPCNFTVVDIGGVYTHTVEWCICQGAPARWLQLLRMGLYPASITKPATAFTFRVLEYYQLDALECQTSASAFTAKLKRLTNKHHPKDVPVSLIVMHL
jgi:hypothetical protein